MCTAVQPCPVRKTLGGLRPVCLLLLAALLICAAPAPADPTVLDDFDRPADWELITSDGVQAQVASVETDDGRALRLDYDFTRGAGFCVLRRATPLELPPNYRFTLTLRGDAPANNLELKLIDRSGENVWWVNRWAYEPPREWTTLQNRARHFDFAWGPSGGAPLDRIGAIEIAVAASSGGKGTLWFDRLTFEELAPPQRPTAPPRVSVSSRAADDRPLEWQIDADGEVAWRSADDDKRPTLTVDFGVLHEFGGLRLAWDELAYPKEYRVLLSTDGEQWETAARVDDAAGGLRYVQLPDAEARYVKIEVADTSRGGAVRLNSFRALPVEFGESANAMYTRIAREAPSGRYPRYLLGRQPEWTVVGVARGQHEALLDTDGAIELSAGGPRLEPFLRINGRLVTWADVETRQTLEEGDLPIPTVTWLADGVRLEITAVAEGEPGNERVRLRYRVHSDREGEQRMVLYLALRPFQVLPPWQNLNLVGGTTRVEQLEVTRAQASVNGTPLLRLDTPSEAFGAQPFSQGDVVETIAENMVPATKAVEDPSGLASAMWYYDVVVLPGASVEIMAVIPLTPDADTRPQAPEPFDLTLTRAREQWRERLNRVRLVLPPEAQPIADTFRTIQAHILINMDGPAIQPGSRTYARSWIRDGALTSTALLYTGHADAVRDFIEWFAPHQFASGKVPCVVDQRGPDPVPEHDSTGQLIYLLRKYYEVTGDRTVLERHLPRVEAGVAYLESLRAQRMTDQYRDGNALQRACYGLVPESISHEGYSAKPMHSYWDNFWVLRGLKDATVIAEVLGRDDLARRYAALRDEFAQTLARSLELAMEKEDITYLPGCVELGDFDATSTTIALYPCATTDPLPDGALQRTFDKYYTFFEQRRDGQLEWEAYTPYEVRSIGSFVRLGQRERAHALIDFFLQDRRPPGWNQWAEVVHRDPATPKFIGDLPHTWVGSDFVAAVRSLFVYEREFDQALVLGAGVTRQWLEADGGVKIEQFPTDYGTLSYHAWHEYGHLRVELRATGEVPPGGFVIALPGAPGADTVRSFAPAPGETPDAPRVVREREASLTIKQ